MEDAIDILLQLGIRQIQQCAPVIIVGSADANVVVVVDIDVVVEVVLMYLDVPLLTAGTHG